MQNKDKGDGIEDSPLDMLLVILLEGASKEVVTPLSLIEEGKVTLQIRQWGEATPLPTFYVSQPGTKGGRSHK